MDTEAKASSNKLIVFSKTGDGNRLCALDHVSMTGSGESADFLCNCADSDPCQIHFAFLQVGEADVCSVQIEDGN